MAIDTVGFDHGTILVRDLDQAHERFVRLGFRLGTRAIHSDGATENETIMLEGNYLEIQTVLRPVPRASDFAEFLKRREGFAGIALSTGDAAAHARDLRSGGVDCADPVTFTRKAGTPDDGAMAEFRVAFIPAGQTPGGQMFLCEHRTPDLVWRPELLTHPNGALAVCGVTVVVDDLDRVTLAYARIFGDTRLTRGGDGARIGTHNIPFRLVTTAGLERRHPGMARPQGAVPPYFAGASLRVADPGKTARLLTRNGIEFREEDNGIVVPPAEACGIFIEFRAGGT